MESRSKGKSKETSSSSYYPTQWSDWEWNEHEGRYSRYRLSGPDVYEYDHKAAAPTNPRTQDAPSRLPADVQQPYTTSQQYTTSPGVSALTQGLAGVSLGPSPALQQPSLAIPQGISGHIRTRNYNTTEETFDPHYKVHQAWEFQAYKIFKVLWAEPNGTGADDNVSGTESVRDVRVGNYNEKISHKVRRFLIIKPDHGFCLCLPISTYTNKGTNKKGIRADTHTVIYTEKKPEILPGEIHKGLTMKPIKVKAPHRHKLDKASRLNYAKLYTVEYNVKVWFIGEVDKGSQWQLVTDYNRIHPPLVPPPASAQTHEDTFDYAQGGSSGSNYRYPLSAAGAQLGGGSYAGSNLYSAASSSTNHPTDPFYGKQQPTSVSSDARSASAPPPPVVYSSSPPGGYPTSSAHGQSHTNPQYQYASITQPTTQSTTYPVSSYTTSPAPAFANPTYQPASYGTNPAYASAPPAHHYDPTVPTEYPARNPTSSTDQTQYQQPTRPTAHHTSSYPDDASIRSGSKKRSGGNSSGRKP